MRFLISVMHLYLQTRNSAKVKGDKTTHFLPLRSPAEQKKKKAEDRKSEDERKKTWKVKKCNREKCKRENKIKKA